VRPIPLAPNRVRRFYRGGAAIARLSGPLHAIRCLPPAQPLTAATGSGPLDAGS
jgi:hypothetical protein